MKSNHVSNESEIFITRQSRANAKLRHQKSSNPDEIHAIFRLLKILEILPIQWLYTRATYNGEEETSYNPKINVIRRSPSRKLKQADFSFTSTSSFSFLRCLAFISLGKKKGRKISSAASTKWLWIKDRIHHNEYIVFVITFNPYSPVHTYTRTFSSPFSPLHPKKRGESGVRFRLDVTGVYINFQSYR